MKKYILLTSTVSFFALTTNVKAVGSQTGQSGAQPPTVTNQNSVQNMGEDSRIMLNASPNAVPKMPEEMIGNGAGLQIQQLTQIKESVQIAEKLGQIVQDQNEFLGQAQTVRSQIESRNSFTKMLIGPDYKNLNNMQKLIEQNQLRIKELEEIKTQLTNDGDVEMVQVVIQSLEEENTSLTEMVNNEEKNGGLFGWLVKLFVN